MFSPVDMNEVSLFIKATDVELVTDLLYDLKLIQFLKLKEESLQDFEQSDINDTTHRLLELRSVISVLTPHFDRSAGSLDEDAVVTVKSLMAKQDDLRKDIYKLEDEEKKLSVLKGLKLSYDQAKKMYLASVPSSDKKQLKSFMKTGKSFKTYEVSDKIYFATSQDKKKLSFQYAEFKLPRTTSLESLETKVAKKREALARINSQLGDIADASLRSLQEEERKLTKELGIHEARGAFKRTENIAILSGHVPVQSISLLKRKLEYALGNKFELTVKKADDDAPTHLENGKFESFESLLEMYSMPKYKEFDPTKLMYLIFPFFFGFVLGDAVYGLISLLVFTLAKSYMPNLKDFMTILQLSAISSTIWGVIYGEFIGFKLVGPFWGMFQRAYDPQLLFYFALVFGLIHVNLGVLIGAWNNRHNFKHALYDNLSWIIFQLGILGIVLGSLEILGAYATYVGSALAIVSVAFIYLGHGIAGVVEIPSFFTNIFSYARLMAVGLSSVAIAILINQFSMPMFETGPVGIFFGVLLFTAGHVFNIILGNFESFLHTLRLHYVEFFTKFYSGGGRKFVPFGQENSQESS